MINRAEAIFERLPDRLKTFVISRVVGGVERTYDWLARQAENDRLRREEQAREPITKE